MDMEIKITTKQILNILNAISWIIFIGVGIEAGSFIVNAIISIVKPEYFAYSWQEVDLSALYSYDRGHFFVQMILMSIVAILKAIMFYLIVKILHDNKVNLSMPFNKDMGRFIFNMSYLSFGVGLFSFWGNRYAQWLITKGVEMPDIQYMRLGGADVWLFMGVVLLVIAQLFKRGIEIQQENELTI